MAIVSNKSLFLSHTRHFVSTKSDKVVYELRHSSVHMTTTTTTTTTTTNKNNKNNKKRSTALQFAIHRYYCIATASETNLKYGINRAELNILFLEKKSN